MARKGQTERSESARVRVAVARQVEEVGHMRDCPDRMGELKRRLRRDGSSSRGRRPEPPVLLPSKAGKTIPCNGIYILSAWSEPVGQATRAQAGERRLSRRREDAIDEKRRTTALGDPTREAPPGDHGGAMATTGSHRAKPFGE